MEIIMERRQFLQTTLALGAAGLLPNVGLTSGLLVPDPMNMPLDNVTIRCTTPHGNGELRLNVTEGNSNQKTRIEIVMQTDHSGNILTTPEQLVTLLNTSPLLKNPDGTRRLTARAVTGITPTTSRNPTEVLICKYHFGENMSNYHYAFAHPVSKAGV